MRRRRVSIADLLDRHPVRCPECLASEAVFIIGGDTLQGFWNCVACGHLWPASDQSGLLDIVASKDVH
jgi:hypothetical protein